MAIVQIEKDGQLQPCHEEHVAQFVEQGWKLAEAKPKAPAKAKAKPAAKKAAPKKSGK